MEPFANLRKAALICACAGLALGVSTLAAAHGGLSMDEDYCKLRVGQYVMHFVGYQPDSASGPKEFCEDIPETGRTIVVLDYVDDALRDLPTEVRIIRDTGSPRPDRGHHTAACPAEDLPDGLDQLRADLPRSRISSSAWLR